MTKAKEVKAVYEYLPIFNRSLFFGDDLLAMQKLASKKLGSSADVSLMNGVGGESNLGLTGTIPKKDSEQILGFFMHVNADEGVDTVTHEACHIVNFVFDYIGQDLDVVNDEVQAYLLAYIVKRFMVTVRGE